MKKIWKTMLAAGVMGFAASLCMSLTTFAATESGTIEGGFTWQADTTTATVTVTGSGEVPAESLRNAIDLPNNEKVNYVFDDRITGASDSIHLISNTGSIYAGTNFQSLDTLKQASGPITISEDNPYFASYEGCVYSKDMSTLLYCPYCIEEPTLYYGVKTIAAGAFDGASGFINTLSRVVIPWGVTTIEDGAFSGIQGSTESYVVLPNTITSMTEKSLPGKTRGTGCLFIYQKGNQLVDNILKGKSDSYQTLMANPVNSLAEYYPGQVTPAQNGWVKEGSVWYYYKNGVKQVDWQLVDNVWYYLGTDGIMQTGWITYNGSTYYLRPWGGMMVNGWYQIDSKWYYFQSWGGTAKSQWLYGLDKKWYYVDANGVMLTNTRTPDGYWVDANGVWVR